MEEMDRKLLAKAAAHRKELIASAERDDRENAGGMRGDSLIGFRECYGPVIVQEFSHVDGAGRKVYKNRLITNEAEAEAEVWRRCGWSDTWNDADLEVEDD